MVTIPIWVLLVLIYLAIWKLMSLALWLGVASVRWSRAIDQLVYQYKQRKGRE